MASSCTAPGIIGWASAAGFFQGCADPVLFELSAEVTYGSAAGAEGLSGGLIVLVWNLASCLTLGLAPLLTGAQTINAVTAGTFLLAALVTGVGVRESYSRQNAEEQLTLSKARLAGAVAVGGDKQGVAAAAAAGCATAAAAAAAVPYSDGDLSESRNLLEVSS
eukprot:gene24394-16446_t